MDMIYETPEQTGKKVQEVLTQAFPEVEFSVEGQQFSDRSIVIVGWEDGPQAEEVHQKVSFMGSNSFAGYAEFGFSLGYQYKGKRYCGAEQINVRRILSPSRKEAIQRHLETTREPLQPFVYAPFDYEEAEQELIDSGQLDSKSSCFTESNLPDVQQIENLTAEQKLKQNIMMCMTPDINIPLSLIQSGNDIDHWFGYIAEQLNN